MLISDLVTALEADKPRYAKEAIKGALLCIAEGRSHAEHKAGRVIGSDSCNCARCIARKTVGLLDWIKI